MRTVYLVSFFLVFCIAVANTAGASPTFFDLGDLNLRVTKTEVQQRVRDKLGNTILAKKGYKLAVVTLQGSSKKDAQTTLNVGEFAAVYEEEGKVKSHTSSGISCIEGFWGVAEGGKGVEVYLYCKKGEPVVIKVAISIPDHVDNFSVRYPTLAAGKASVQSPSTETATPAMAATEKLSEPQMVARIRNNPAFSALVIEAIKPQKSSYKARATILGDAVVGEKFYFFLMGANGKTDFPAGDGAIHEIGGTFEFPIRDNVYKFISEEEAPLVFAMLDDIGYAYLRGKGTVIFPDGKEVKLGY